MSRENSSDTVLNVPLGLNRLHESGYDTSGNLLSGGYGYDAEERMSSAAGITYTYDGDGRRARKSNGKLYWTGLGGEPLLESDAAGNFTAEYIFFNGKRVARRDLPGGAVHYYFSDHLGTASVITSSTGVVQKESDYYPYGGERRILDADSNSFKFTGKERDTETGLDYFGARYYASTMGRFLSPDWSAKEEPVPYAKLDNPQTLNLYAYVGNNPLIHIDADGHDSLGLSFDNYRAEVHGYHIPMTGHGALITIDSKGHTRGFEYGRYGDDKGVVRRLKTSNLVMKDGKPTEASMKKLLAGIAKQEHNYTGTISGAYYKMSDQNTIKVDAYAEGRMSQNGNPDRTPYSTGVLWGANNCGTFVRDGIEAGGGDTSHTWGDSRPERIISDMQKSSDGSITYDAKNGTLTTKDKKP